jgi:hypothetical protein
MNEAEQANYDAEAVRDRNEAMRQQQRQNQLNAYSYEGQMAAARQQEIMNYGRRNS